MRYTLFVFLLIILAGCDHKPAERVDAPPLEPIATGPKWIAQGESVVLPADAPGDNAALAAAIARARETADDARKRWETAPANDRDRWAVKWAAPLETGEVEYVWVRPEHWSPFRIEGVLLSEPVHDLPNAFVKGDNVSFPAEELVDWAHIVGDATPAVVEGNFTEAVLMQSTGASSPE